MSIELMDLEKGEKYFFYVDKAGGNSVEKFNVVMKEPINLEKMEKAAKSAVEAFPLFGMRPVVDKDGWLFLTKNPLPVLVEEESDQVKVLGTEETNGYLFRIICKNTELFINAHHSLGDGRTIMAFGMTVVYYYLLEAGINVDAKGMVYTKEDLKEPTLLSAFLKDAAKVECGESKGAYYPQNVFTFPKPDPGEQLDEGLYLVTWDSRELISYTKSHQITPTPFIATIIANVIHDMFSVGEKHIVFGIPVDMRGKMNSRSQRNYIGNIRLPYYPEYRELPFEEQAKRLKADMDVQMDMSNIIPRVLGLEKVIDGMIQTPLCENEVKESPQRSGAVAQSILLTNVGRLALPEGMEDYIKEVQIYTSSKGGKAAAGMLTMGNRGTMFL
ncbi:MAG: hypothetical protein E7277_08965, partial [Lachnospiraceae bacterium]|nr:hypothetical protein [Lachnospiraceae bacterium]